MTKGPGHPEKVAVGVQRDRPEQVPEGVAACVEAVEAGTVVPRDEALREGL